MTGIPLINRIRTGIIPALLFILVHQGLEAQGAGFNYFYRVYFRDKGENTVSGFTASDLLSERAILRRQKAGISVPDYRDLPVWQKYVDEIKSMGYTLHCTSKWLNSALFKTVNPANYSLMEALSSVAGVRVVKKPAGKSGYSDKLDFETEQADLPPYDRPITMLNGYALYNAGYTGSGVLIAVLDGGFLNADQISSLASLRNRKGIKAVYDFVDNDETVYTSHTHGTAVMSILAGRIPGVIQGTAPDADFMLFRTEDVATEYSVEEDFWAAGAEFADSAGADIISSSLGYYVFDDAPSSYKFSDMDGNTTFVTRAADVAASKGILVLSSAGNERNKIWQRIIAPTDGDSVVSVGAVDGYGMISTFSSAGPSYDRRIKPDNSAMGVSVTIQTTTAGVVRGNGTSFSCPVLSGMSACLVQAVPEATNTEIIEALHKAGDRYLVPDSLYGYGIPDMAKALEILQDDHLIIPVNELIVRPNPIKGEFEIVFKEPPGHMMLEIFASSGVSIFRKNFGDYAGRSLRINALAGREQGLYLVRLTTGTGTYFQKVIKLRD